MLPNGVAVTGPKLMLRRHLLARQLSMRAIFCVDHDC